MPQEQFPFMQNYNSNHQHVLRDIIRIGNNIMQGKTNNTGEITLDASSASTDVNLTKGDLTPTTVILFMPTTANAASEKASGSFYVSSINAASTASGGLAKHSFRIAHQNNAQTDRTFRYVLIG